MDNNNNKLSIEQLIHIVNKIELSKKQNVLCQMEIKNKAKDDNYKQKIGFGKRITIDFLFDDNTKLDRLGIDYDICKNHINDNSLAIDNDFNTSGCNSVHSKSNNKNISLFSSICYYITDNYCAMTADDRYIYIDRLIAKLTNDLNKRQNLDILNYNKMSDSDNIKDIKMKLKKSIEECDYTNDLLKYISNYFEQNIFVIVADKNTIDIFTNVDSEALNNSKKSCKKLENSLSNNNNINAAPNTNINKHRNNIVLYKFDCIYEPVLVNNKKIMCYNEVEFFFNISCKSSNSMSLNKQLCIQHINIIYSFPYSLNTTMDVTCLSSNAQNAAIVEHDRSDSAHVVEDSCCVDQTNSILSNINNAKNDCDNISNKTSQCINTTQTNVSNVFSANIDELTAKMKYDVIATIARTEGINLYNGKKKKTKQILIDELQSTKQK